MAQTLTTELWEELERINKEVNRDIKYEYDEKQYGTADFWTVVEGKGKGDCDDYSLTKIVRLVDETEWDRENLSIAVCYVEGANGQVGKGGGHAVCVARTDRGDFVLDNRHKKVMAYDKLPYRWVMMEDYANKSWTRIES
jgi:predicted transglutaminase-like cysteine proteinase